MEKAEIFQ